MMAEMFPNGTIGKDARNCISLNGKALYESDDMKKEDLLQKRSRSLQKKSKKLLTN